MKPSLSAPITWSRAPHFIVRLAFSLWFACVLAGPRATAAAEGYFPLDLTSFYNAPFTNNWTQTPWSDIPRGERELDGIPFRIGGILKLTGTEAARRGQFFPPEVRGIPAQSKASRLIVLLAAAHGRKDGVPMVNVVLNYVNGDTRKVRLSYGVHARNWIRGSGEKQSAPEDINSKVIWTGQSKDGDTTLRLYQTILLNPLPDQEIRSLDFASLLGKASPMIFGITLETNPLQVSEPPKKNKLARKVIRRASGLDDSAFVRNIRLKAVEDSAKAVVTNATASLYVVSDGSSYPFGERLVDAQGQAVFPYPPQEATGLRFLVRAPGFATAMAKVERDPRAGIPSEVTVGLSKGARIGGFVRGRQGEPIAGAEITISTISNVSPAQVVQTGLESVETDRRGHWSSTSLSSNFQRAAFHVSHAEYNSANFLQAANAGSNGLQVTQADLLGDKAGFVLESRIRVSGIVLNERGNAVTNVDISYRGPDRPRQRLRTDAAGRFSFLVNDPGKATLGFVPEGFAPEYLTLSLKQGIKPLVVKLSRGTPTTLRVRDESGAPVDGASVYLSSWNTTRLISWQTKTDAQGRFTWTNAPVGGVVFSISKNDFISRSVAIGIPAQGEQQVTLKRAFKIFGTVLNAESHEPVPVFDMTPGRRFFANEPIRWDYGNQDRFKQGHFSFNAGESGEGETFVMLEAVNFAPFLSKPYTTANIYSNTFELARARAITGAVMLANGTLARKASVLLAGFGDEAALDTPTEFRRGRMNGASGTANGAGSFKMEPRLNATSMFAASAQGIGRATLAELETTGKIILQPWGKVTGILRMLGKPPSNLFVAIHSPEHPFVAENELPLSFLFRTRPDSKGNFSFDKVPPGEWKLSLYYRIKDVARGPLPVSDGFTVVVKAGETNQVNFAPAGRTLTGKVQVMNASGSTVDWLRDVHVLRQQMPGLPDPYMLDLKDEKSEAERRIKLRKSRESERKFWLSEKGRTVQRMEHSYMLQFETNGNFRIENVPAGSYDLIIAPTDPTSERYVNEPIAIHRQKISVRVEKSGEPMDLGTIKLQLRPGLHIGQTAPSFKVKSIEGKQLHVEDFRGSYLLVHFWSTASNGNVDDLDTLRGMISQEGRGGPKVRVLGLCFDRNRKAAEAYVQGSDTPWEQCLLGAAGAKLAAEYGIDSAGGVVLISPDGQIASKALHGDYIRYAFRKATSAGRE